MVGFFNMEQYFFRLNRFIILFLIAVFLVGLFFSPFSALATASSSAQVTEEIQPTISLSPTSSPVPSSASPSASLSASPSSITVVLKEGSPGAVQEATIAGEAPPSSFLEKALLNPIKSFIKSLIKGEKPSLSKDNFQAKEKIKIDLGNYQPEEIIVSLTSQGEEVLEDQEVTDDTLEISRPRNFKPGKYHLNIKDKETERTLFDQDFTWGVLAIDRKSVV